jgi:hypothetical protein
LVVAALAALRPKKAAWPDWSDGVLHVCDVLRRQFDIHVQRQAKVRKIPAGGCLVAWMRSCSHAEARHTAVHQATVTAGPTALPPPGWTSGNHRRRSWRRCSCSLASGADDAFPGERASPAHPVGSRRVGAFAYQTASDADAGQGHRVGHIMWSLLHIQGRSS